MYNTGLSSNNWYKLKDAILGASANNETYYKELPAKLQEHEVGKLVYAYLYENKKRSLNKAVKLMTSNADQAWLILEKS